MRRLRLYLIKALCDGCDREKRRVVSPTGRYQVCTTCRRALAKDR